MDRKISDMLDDLYVDDLDIGRKTPLSHKRIRKRTMARFEQKPAMSFRWLGKTAVIVAVIMALTITVFAADVVLGDGKLFGSFFGDVLSESQMAVADDIGRDFQDGFSFGNARIIPIRAVADEGNYFLHVRVEAPEGVVLADLDESEHYYYDFAAGGRSWQDNKMIQVQYYLDPPQSQWVDLSCSHSVTTLGDPDPTDNVKEFVIHLSRNSDNATFNGPWSKRLVLPGLFIRQYRSSETKTVFTGWFPFEIGIDDQNRDDMELVVDLGGLVIHNEEHDFDVTLHEATITPLSITVEYESTDPYDRYIFPKGGPIQLVMKDGSVVDAMDAYYDADAHYYPHPDSVLGISNYHCFDQIVVVSDIDYLLIGGEHIVDVN